MKTEHNSLFYCLQLIRSENVGPITFWQLVKRYGSPEAAIKQIDQVNQYSTRKITVCPEDAVVREIETHKKLGIHLICAYDSSFPSLLKTLPDCPPILSVRGQLDTLLTNKILGIVGARNASLSGRQLAYQIANDLSEQGWVIASGLARGIDAYAHGGALTKGKTIAIVAGGVDIIYPPEHASLYEKIQENGCIVSEMPIGMHPAAMHFPRRNRIISGLSKGVVVVEAALKSGSLITANFALEQGKELFAVPGSPSDPRCKGTNDLLRRGAHVVECAHDILSILDTIQIDPGQGLSEPDVDAFNYSSQDEFFGTVASSQGIVDDLFSLNQPLATEKPIIKLRDLLLMDLSSTPVSIEELLLQYECSAADILAIIADLELSGDIIRYPNGMISRLNS